MMTRKRKEAEQETDCEGKRRRQSNLMTNTKKAAFIGMFHHVKILERLKETAPSSISFGTPRVIYLTDDEQSWVVHIPSWYYRIYQNDKFYDQEKEETLGYHHWLRRCWELHPNHQDSIQLFGKDVLMPRFQQVYGEHSYKFSNKNFDAVAVPPLLQGPIKRMQDLVVNPDDNSTFLNACLVNWYANGEHYMGPHSDDERIIRPFSPIFSLSLGATRNFRFLPKTSSKVVQNGLSTGKSVTIELKDGDLVIMGGTCQITHKHALPKMKKCREKRINITLRCFDFP